MSIGTANCHGEVDPSEDLGGGVNRFPQPPLMEAPLLDSERSVPGPKVEKGGREGVEVHPGGFHRRFNP